MTAPLLADALGPRGRRRVLVASAVSGLVILALVAVAVVHLRGGFFLPKGFEYALTLLAASIALALTGPGAAALDTLLGRRRAA